MRVPSEPYTLAGFEPGSSVHQAGPMTNCLITYLDYIEDGGNI
jgi:hypothetical protein